MSVEIYITGMGIVTGIGNNAGETLNALRENKSGIGKINFLNTIHDIPCAEVQLTDEQLKEKLHIPLEEVVTRTALIGIMAAKEALLQAKLNMDGKKRVAFINGTTVGGMEKSELFYFDFLENDTRNEYIEAHDCGACTERIADYFGGFSYVSTPSTACSSAANALMLGANLIDAGVVDIAVAGGSECITKFHLNGFKSLMILDDEICSPFDQNRSGLNLGEGAAFLVLESSKTLKERNVEALCKLSGYGNACDAFHQTASSPEGNGAFLAMQAALQMAGIKPSDVDYINAHGTGTPNNDESEGQAIVRVFGTKPPYVSSTKSLTGHTTSASGGVEAVISILAMDHHFIPANFNFKQKMDSLPFEPVKDVLEGIDIHHILSNSFGFGGNNSSLLFSKV
jgi:3-oxoacyl-[acyl-carrier-protein] synthase II